MISKSKWTACLSTALAAFVFLGAAEALMAQSGTADVRLVCLSPRFRPATTRVGGINYTVFFEHFSGPNFDPYPNGELRPFLTDSVGDFQSVYGYYILRSPAYTARDPVDDFYIDLPAMGDANNNGLSDFYEVPLAVDPATTLGDFEETVQSNGTNIISWSRAANTNVGACNMHMISHYLQLDATFPVVFELIDYAGKLYYTPGNPSVGGWLSLTQTGHATNQLFGAIRFDKASPDLLSGQPASLTNSARHVFQISWRIPSQTEPSLVQRFGQSYSGYFSMDDGDPSTATSDYWMWAILITDNNDANGDGIPDFTDSVLPPVTPPVLPTLSIGWQGTKIALGVGGTPGQPYAVESCTNLTGAAWAPAFVTTVTGNEPQVTLLPSPAGPTFWRARQAE